MRTHKYWNRNIENGNRGWTKQSYVRTREREAGCKWVEVKPRRRKSLIWYQSCTWLWRRGLQRSDRLRLMGHPCSLTWLVGLIPCVNFPRSESLVYWPCNHHSAFLRVLASHAWYRESFLDRSPSFHYSSPRTLNSGVLNGCVTKKLSQL